jgi:hypothetical protein
VLKSIKSYEIIYIFFGFSQFISIEDNPIRGMLDINVDTSFSLPQFTSFEINLTSQYTGCNMFTKC